MSKLLAVIMGLVVIGCSDSSTAPAVERGDYEIAVRAGPSSGQTCGADIRITEFGSGNPVYSVSLGTNQSRTVQLPLGSYYGRAEVWVPQSNFPRQTEWTAVVPGGYTVYCGI